ncbi:phenylalanine--tRNA ligase subunit beta [Macrococcus hajekii]|uniref:Phenylalanine--tRNA ligase beta subunit n=1 Tax=Macrococcus hajekii TaxID=198482 RepID=A0A4V6PPP7_9STAP|nr:phenylalanine--tRNA ligase subunit beta [Macrococcus hajekii]TDM02765.1 phenylalanine--tRNA ligase subunit beta [Macrococcus hajekii]GGB03716.1 phenylalanine--tRNA ligase beta subunit [Macrococcus hajekii]
MLVSKEWLSEFVRVNVPVVELAEKITRSGIEVEEITDYTKDIKNLVVGHVLTKEKHPDADKLNVTTVDVGEETLQIVCGAPNVEAGQYVIVCKPGGRLPGGVKIKRAKLRGVESNGMICSLGELGIAKNLVPAQYETGIFNFPEELTPGTDALEALFLADGVMEFGLTPNRADAMSMLGSAYEVSALYEEEIEFPEADLEESGNAADAIAVRIEDTDASPYYAARVVRDVVVKPSPTWMQMRLIKAGIRPINNVVDISNYVMMEIGQPLHMFDADKIGSSEIVVRYASEGEKMTTLDDKERELTTEDIVVTNGNEPIALAGVMGGDFSEVTEETKNVVIESALFNAINVRKTSRQTGLRSEASSRFEKGVAPERVNMALDRAAFLLQEHAEGNVLAGIVSAGELPELEVTIQITTDEVNGLVGFDLSNTEIKTIFERLGFDSQVDGDSFNVHVPTRRGDITIKEDLIEEVARIYGYDELPSTLPMMNASKRVGLTAYQAKRRAVKHLLEGLGLNQAITYALVSEEKAQQFTDHTQDTVKLMMPMSADHAVLRQSLLPHLIDAVQYNNARQMKDVALYEIGNIFHSRGTEQPVEIENIAGIITGQFSATEWQDKVEPVDFYVMKGIVEALAAKLNVEFTYERAEVEELHPGRSARVLLNGKVIGVIGQLHPLVEAAHDLKATYVFELNLQHLLEETSAVKYHMIPKFPGISRDIALEVERARDTGELIDIIMNADKKYLQRAMVFDVYEGEHIAEDKKSVAIRMEFLNLEETLKDEDIQPVVDRILENLTAAGAKLRG